MVAKKRSRGPKIITYVFDVNVETGKILRTHIENPVTGERIKLKGNPTSTFDLGPGGGIAPRIYGSITPPRPITPTQLMRVPMPDPPPDWLKASIKTKTKK